MPKLLRCRGIGWDCPFQVTGAAPDEVVQEMWQHVKEVHRTKATFIRMTGWHAAIQTVREREAAS